MKSNAAGQLLGYSLQFPRALCRLLQCKPGGAVSVEVKGDVSSYFPEGIELVEEDKSSVNKNPLTNRSTDLWKTFYNWVSAVIDKDLNLESTLFVLYCNQSGQTALVDEFHSASTKESAESAIRSAKEKLDTVSDDHEIRKYYDFVVNENSEIFIGIIQNFELIIGTGAGYKELKLELEANLIPSDSIDYALNQLGGWLQKYVNESIAANKPAIVTFDEYKKQFIGLYTRIRQRALIDFASVELDTNRGTLSENRRVRPLYVQQLEFIDLGEDEIVEAVSDFLSADYNRNKWIDAEIIDESTAADFENKLQSYWKSVSRKTEIILSKESEVNRGVVVFSECQAKDQNIGSEPPPDRTVQGTYHLLANNLDLGWHPQWSRLISEREVKNGTSR